MSSQEACCFENKSAVVSFRLQMFYPVGWNLFLLSLLLLLIIPLHSFDIELTVLIPANERECFHQPLEAGKTIEIEYEVVVGGDNDINYWFYSPSNRLLHSDFKKRDGHHTLKLEETGEYRFCFDNSFSRFSQKQVYFSLSPAYDNDQSHHDQANEPWMTDMEKDDLGELQEKVADLKVGFLARLSCSETRDGHEKEIADAARMILSAKMHTLSIKISSTSNGETAFVFDALLTLLLAYLTPGWIHWHFSEILSACPIVHQGLVLFDAMSTLLSSVFTHGDLMPGLFVPLKNSLSE